MKTRVGAVIGIYAALAFLVVPVFPHFQSPNELTRWATAAALVEHGTFEVSSLLPLFTSGFEDLSVAGGRTYSNKAPGGALVALPGYLAARWIAGPASAGSMRGGVTAMRWLGATVPVLAIALLMVKAAGRLGGEVSRAPLAIAALLFGTPVGTYGLLLFSHALVAACLFGAWAALFLPGSPRAQRLQELLAGGLIGLAVFSEYPAAVPGLILVVCSAGRRDWSRVARVVAGGVPFAVALALYDTAAFGGPLALSSGHEKYAEFVNLAGTGMFGIGAPTLAAFWGLLFGASKGLFVFSPIFLVSMRGYDVAARALSRDACLALGLVPASLIALYAGYPNWHGGWTVGPRYLVAAMPFLLFPLFFRRGGALEAGLLGASILAVSLGSLVFPFIPTDFPFPWGTFSLPLLARGLVAPNALHSVARPLAVAAPFLLVAAAIVCAVPRRRLLPCALGAALSLGAGLLALARAPFPLAVERAYIEEVYLGRAGALESTLRGVPLPRQLADRRALELTLGPGPWRF